LNAWPIYVEVTEETRSSLNKAARNADPMCALLGDFSSVGDNVIIEQTVLYLEKEISDGIDSCSRIHTGKLGEYSQRTPKKGELKVQLF